MNKRLLGFLIILIACTLFVRSAVYFVPQLQVSMEGLVFGRLEIMAILSLVYMFALLLGLTGMLTLMRADSWPRPESVEASPGHVLDQIAAIFTLLGLPFLAHAVWGQNRKNQSDADRLAYTRALDFHMSMTLFLIPALLLLNFAVGALLLPFVIVYWLIFIVINTIRVALGKMPWYSGGFAIINRPPKKPKTNSKEQRHDH